MTLTVVTMGILGRSSNLTSIAILHLDLSAGPLLASTPYATLPLTLLHFSPSPCMIYTA